MNKQKIIAFLRANAVSLTSNITTFVIVVLLIVLPQTHIYYTVTHFTEIVKVVDKMQTVTADTGNKGLGEYLKSILSK